MFDAATEAEAAVRDVEASGLPSAVIRRYVKDDPALRDYQGRESRRQGGFWSWLLGEDTNRDEYRDEYAVYDRSIAAGGTVVTVTVDDAHISRIVEILNRHAPIDIQERAAQYGIPSGKAASASETPVAAAGTASRMGTSAYDSETGMAAAEGTAGSQEAVIPLSEEQLQVGTRTVDRGTTRIRRYVVRTPVEETVTLREEQVTIERRHPVAPGTPGVPEGAFEERTVEVRATGEEPVVSKTARVAEEVVVRKEVGERTETVRDTVRREEVQTDKEGRSAAK